jgi:cobalt-zinc-cadmium efflux system outer membrane protein
VHFIGGWMIWQPPLFNRKQGEILQRQAERDKVLMDVRRVEVQIQLDVQSAMARLDQARKWRATYEDQTLPALSRFQQTLEKMYAQGQPGVDVTKLIDIRRRLLKSRDAYLDALWEFSQARADLVAAVADPVLAGLDADQPSSPQSCPAGLLAPLESEP